MCSQEAMEKISENLNSIRELFWKLSKTETPEGTMESLIKKGLDKSTDGFWVYYVDSHKEYYSPKFRETLGFENEIDFPNDFDSWVKQIKPEYMERAVTAFKRHIESKGKVEYVEYVEYNKKAGGQVGLICEGNIVDFDMNGKPRVVLGIHKIYRNEV